MEDSAFDIFSGIPYGDCKWMQSVNGLGAAHKRLQEIAAETPGKYFMFNAWNSCVLTQVDTGKVIAQADPSAQVPTKTLLASVIRDAKARAS